MVLFFVHQHSRAFANDNARITHLKFQVNNFFEKFQFFFTFLFKNTNTLPSVCYFTRFLPYFPSLFNKKYSTNNAIYHLNILNISIYVLYFLSQIV